MMRLFHRTTNCAEPVRFPAFIPSRLKQTYTIAFAVRTGSNQLCRLFRQHDIGKPGELFQTLPGTELSPETRETWLHEIIRKNMLGEIFGSKMTHDQRARFEEFICSIGYCCGLEALLPNHKWIWLRRRDKVAQAVSLYLAEMTGFWSRELGEPVENRELKYHYLDVHSCFIRVLVNDEIWKLYFTSKNIKPCEIWYEDMLADPIREVKRVTRHLGLPVNRQHSAVVSDLAIQRDNRSREMCDRFRRDLLRVGEEAFAGELGKPLQRWNAFVFERQWNDEGDPKG